jgi:hypothetical protein
MKAGEHENLMADFGNKSNRIILRPMNRLNIPDSEKEPRRMVKFNWGT